MKNLILFGTLIAVALLSSCKKNEWNLNEQPKLTLNAIEITNSDSTFLLKNAPLSSGGTLVVDTGGVAVKMFFTATGGNKLEQISFHDGTWGSNMTLTAGDTIQATPPASRYKVGAKEASFVINFAKIDAKTVLTMFATDEFGMSGDFDYIIDTKILKATD